MLRVTTVCPTRFNICVHSHTLSDHIHYIHPCLDEQGLGFDRIRIEGSTNYARRNARAKLNFTAALMTLVSESILVR